MDVAGEGGVSTCLGTPPSVFIAGTVFNKSEFRDALCLRYGLPLYGVPLSCVCARDMTSHHALTCASGGSTSFIAEPTNNCHKDCKPFEVKENAIIKNEKEETVIVPCQTAIIKSCTNCST